MWQKSIFGFFSYLVEDDVSDLDGRLVSHEFFEVEAVYNLVEVLQVQLVEHPRGNGERQQ